MVCFAPKVRVIKGQQNFFQTGWFPDLDLSVPICRLLSFFQWTAEGAMSKNQKPSKLVKINFDTFRQFSRWAKKSQQSSKSVRDTFRQFSRGTNFPVPFRGYCLSWELSRFLAIFPGIFQKKGSPDLGNFLVDLPRSARLPLSIFSTVTTISSYST